VEEKKILLTGVCYVHRLLQLRFDKQNQIDRRNYIEDVHPNFDLDRVDFFKNHISEQFLFTDFHGKYDSLKIGASNLLELLYYYAPRCRRMYIVGMMGMKNTELSKVLSPKDYQKVSSFWYFLFDEKWNPQKCKDWADKRDRAVRWLLKLYPHLKFIFYERQSYVWWQRAGLPDDRVINWEVDWGMTESQYEEIRQHQLEKGIGGGHRFPTEDSYNELCDMILKDCKNT